MTDFYADMKRFGSRRALIRDEHRWRVRQFIQRQKMLATLGAAFLAFHLITGMRAFVALSIFVFTAATTEARIMRATGRTYQTNKRRVTYESALD